MKKLILLAAAAIAPLALTMPAQAHDTISAEASAKIDTVLAADYRKDESTRDQFRHPKETLEFFRVSPDMTVVEYAPGGGWYSHVLAPYVADQGSYVAVNLDSSGRTLTDEQRARVQAWPQSFAASLAESTGVPASAITAFESDEIPDGMEGKIDRILIFRNIHSMLNANLADSELRNLRRLLADDGMVGIVQHRARDNAPYEYTNGSKGYVRQDDVVALMTLNGFELVESSEINANPNDTANWPDGVWTLPPNYALDDKDRAKYAAIGESDRMTLLFRKRD